MHHVYHHLTIVNLIQLPAIIAQAIQRNPNLRNFYIFVCLKLTENTSGYTNFYIESLAGF